MAVMPVTGFYGKRANIGFTKMLFILAEIQDNHNDIIVRSHGEILTIITISKILLILNK